MKMLILRPYYGVQIQSDMHGDLGVVEPFPQVFPDISFVLAATIASRSEQVQLDVIDAHAEKLFPDAVLSRLAAAYDLVVIKAAAASVKYDLEFARTLKKRFPEAKVVLGGHVAKLLREWIIRNMPEIDEVAAEPLEFYMYKLMNQTTSVSMDELPTPDYSLLPYQAYTEYNGLTRVSLYMTRGCKTGCSYCPHYAFFGSKIDSRSVDKVLSDIDDIAKLGIPIVEFKDQFFTQNRDAIVQLCKGLIAKQINIKWRCQTRIESLDYELIDLMVESGLQVIYYGVESASPKTLKSFNRPTNHIAKIKDLNDYLMKKGVFAIAFYIIGFPEDTWESINDTFKLATKIKSTSAVFFVYNPYLYNDPEYASLEITPELFRPFENNLTLNTCKNLSADELSFLELQLQILYKNQVDDLKVAYDYVYKYLFPYMKEVAQKVKAADLFFK